MHRSLIAVCASAGLLAVACAGSSAAPVDPTAPAVTPAAVSAPEPVIAPALLASICSAQPCGGGAALVRVFRDGSGRIARLSRLYGECTHSPAIVFDPDGTQVDIVAEHPITPGSPEAEALRARHDVLFAGLVETDVILCSNGRRRDP